MSACRLIFTIFYAVLLLAVSYVQTQGQDVKVSGKFLADSIKIGEPVAYSLTARYPQHLTLLFPDSTYTFFPFEFEKKIFYSTKTSNGISYDSTIYYFTSFELDQIQKLSLPAFIVSLRDCTLVAAEPDSVFLVEVAETPPDSLSAQNLPLKTNILYENVWHQFNYFIILIILTSLVIIALVIWFVFGKKIIRYFKIKKITKRHYEFITNFTENINKLSENQSSKQTEQAVFLWKKYMEYLERKPYTKLTTKETAAVTPDEVLRQSLKDIDSAIYGHTHNVVNALEYLKEFSENQFQKRLADIKHG
jgi:Sec-independent protein translocase protein TatA